MNISRVVNLVPFTMLINRISSIGNRIENLIQEGHNDQLLFTALPVGTDASISNCSVQQMVSCIL